MFRHRLSDVEWAVLQDFEAILNVPHQVQQTMSKEANPVLSGSIPAFEMFMTTWERLGEKHPRLKPFTDIGLRWATKYYSRMDNTDAYIVAMGLLLESVFVINLTFNSQLSILRSACHGSRSIGMRNIFVTPQIPLSR